MEIVPVIDLKAGIAVHAIRGERQNYGPVRSVLTSSTQAIDIAVAYREQLGCSSVYIADLDAIHGEPIQSAIIEQIGQVLPRLWVDCGCATDAHVEWIQQIREDCRAEIVVVLGLESLTDSTHAAAMIEQFGDRDDIVISLDLRDGAPIIGDGWGESDSYSIIRLFDELGICNYFVLDLASVGSLSGPASTDLIHYLRQKNADSVIAHGGGVRDIDDLIRLRDIGCDHAMVASAIHNGTIGAKEVASIQIS